MSLPTFTQACMIAEDVASRAKQRYGPYSSPHEVLGVLQEEFKEVVDSAHANDWDAFRAELIDIAAVCLRCASERTKRESSGEV